MVRKSIQARPEWSRKILASRQALKLTQGELGRRLKASAMAVSRWERGEAEPPAQAYMDLMQILPVARRRLRQGGTANVQIVYAGAGKVRSLKPTDFVAIPLLPGSAATPGEVAEPVADLDQLTPEAIWAAPAEWCPNPTRTISLRVKGNSMSPLILDGYIIAVDTSEVSRDDLVGQIVVAWNTDEKRLVASRLIRFDHTYALVSDQREYAPILLASESKWRILGRVLWWTGKPR